MADNLKDKRYIPDTERSRYNLLIFSGLLAVPVVSVVQLLQLSKPLPAFLFASLLVFAVSIPFLAASIDIRTMSLRYKYDVNVRGLLPMMYIGMITSVAGIACIFFYFHWIAGVVFLASSLVGVILSLCHYLALEAVNSPESEEEANQEDS
jgi:hypothetical protein